MPEGASQSHPLGGWVRPGRVAVRSSFRRLRPRPQGPGRRVSWGELAQLFGWAGRGRGRLSRPPRLLPTLWGIRWGSEGGMRPPSSESLRAAPGGVCAPRRGVSAPLWECVSPACRARGPGVSGRAGAAPAAPRSRLSRTRVRGPAPASSQPGTGAGLRVRGSPRALATQPAAGSPRRFPGLPRRPLLIPACGRTGPLRPQRRGIAREWRTRTRAPGLVTRTPDPADLAAPPQSRVLPGAQFTLCDGGPSLCLHGALQGFSEARAMKCPERVLSTRTALFSDYPWSCVP